eukprot:120582-Prymnesium_polylepis.1
MGPRSAVVGDHHSRHHARQRRSPMVVAHPASASALSQHVRGSCACRPRRRTRTARCALGSCPARRSASSARGLAPHLIDSDQ